MKSASCMLVVGCFLVSCSTVVESGDEDMAPSAGADAGPSMDDDDDGQPPLFEVCGAPLVAGSGKRIRALYLVPSDRQPDPVVVANIEDALGDVQVWLQGQGADGATLRFADPVVEVVTTTHPSAYYNSTPADGYGARYYFWGNGLKDAFALSEATWSDPDNVWLIFLDAETTCETTVGAVDRVAMFSARDIGALTGDAPVCGDAVNRCRSVGIVALNILTALNVPDPADCVDDDAQTSCPDSLVTQYGIASYPNATLAKDQVQYLSDAGFLRPGNLGDCEFACDGPAIP